MQPLSDCFGEVEVADLTGDDEEVEVTSSLPAASIIMSSPLLSSSSSSSSNDVEAMEIALSEHGDDDDDVQFIPAPPPAAGLSSSSSSSSSSGLVSFPLLHPRGAFEAATALPTPAIAISNSNTSTLIVTETMAAGVGIQQQQQQQQQQQNGLEGKREQTWKQISTDEEYALALTLQFTLSTLKDAEEAERENKRRRAVEEDQAYALALQLKEEQDQRNILELQRQQMRNEMEEHHRHHRHHHGHHHHHNNQQPEEEHSLRTQNLILVDSIPGEVEKGLFIGSVGCAYNLQAMSEHKITHVLCVARKLKQQFPNRFTYRMVLGVKDEEYVNIAEHFAECTRFIAETLQNEGNRVLIHCRMGKSRSCTVLCAFLIMKRGLSFEEALAAVRRVRPIANPNEGFCRQLRALAAQVREQRWREEAAAAAAAAAAVAA